MMQEEEKRKEVEFSICISLMSAQTEEARVKANLMKIQMIQTELQIKSSEQNDWVLCTFCCFNLQEKYTFCTKA